MDDGAGLEGARAGLEGARVLGDGGGEGECCRFWRVIHRARKLNELVAPRSYSILKYNMELVPRTLRS
jgi:hypothetical protein